jgi:hypothetical protein
MDDCDKIEQLIEAVRGFPCLWQVSNKSYKDQRARENAWEKVAEETGFTKDFSMKKWKSLRDKFVRELKRIKKKVSGDEGPPPSSTWSYFQVLSFVQQSVKHRS